MIVNVPINESGDPIIGCIDDESGAGYKRQSRISNGVGESTHASSARFYVQQSDGRYTVDVPPHVLRSLIAGRQGLQWERVNGEAIALLGRL